MNAGFHLFPFALCRVAALSYGTEEPQNAQSLLHTPYFRSALFLASRSFFGELKKKAFQYEALSVKEKLTLEKYANRIVNRSTPFGAFAGFCRVPLFAEVGPLVINDMFRLHLLPSFQEMLALYEKERGKLQSKTLLRTNGSAYATPRAVRYIHYRQDENGCRHFSVRQVGNNPTVKRVMRFCRSARGTEETLGFLTGPLRLEAKDAEGFLDELIDLQVLEPAWQPNITGEGCCKRLLKQLGRRNEHTPDALFSRILDHQQFFNLPFQEKLTLTGQGYGSYYANLELHATGGLPERVGDRLQDALYAFSKMGSSEDPPALKDFAREFGLRFGGRAIPLMTALDPELGISYGGLAQTLETPPLLEGISFAGPDTAAQQVPWGPLQQLLMKKWPGDKNNCISLSHADLDGLPANDRKMPPSFSLPFRLAGDLLVAEAGGGNSALALLGRFTPFNNGILESAQEIAAAEQLRDPEVIFAEIACITDSHTDNINRREQLRDFEITVRTGSTAPDDRQISLADLYVSVISGEVFLWSSKLPKRIIPRLSSAYNFQRSDLPVFRFLGDLQYQGLQHHWGLDTGLLFPDLDFYPRITYGECVLAVACWRFSLNIFPDAGFKENFECFEAWAEKSHLPRLFALGRHDQYLIFDWSAPESMRLFFSEAARADPLLLREVIREPARGGAVVNPMGESLASQFIATVLSSTPVYPGQIDKPSLRETNADQDIFLPGSAWLYYQVYCLPANSASILQAISRAARILLRQKQISQWFFVRYLDPEPHLRIRLMAGEGLTGELINSMTELFEDLDQKGLVRSLRICTYERETERYASAPVTLAERAFHFSSVLITRWLSKTGGESTVYIPALRVTYDTVLLFIPQPAERLAFIQYIRDNLQRENSRAKGLKSNLEAKKRAFKNEVYRLMKDENFYKVHGLSRAAGEYLGLVKDMAARQPGATLQLLADLNHMHINRAFSTEMRRQELVVYTLLYQYELSVQKQGA